VRIGGIQAEDSDGVVGKALEATKHHLGLDGDVGFFTAQKRALKSTYRALDLIDLFKDGGCAGRTRNWTTFGRFSSFAFEYNCPCPHIGKTINAVE
jgi:hypothetical protein